MSKALHLVVVARLDDPKLTSKLLPLVGRRKLSEGALASSLRFARESTLDAACAAWRTALGAP